MNGNSLLIDTNIALYLLDGDEFLIDLLEDNVIHLSFITELELLGYSKLNGKSLQRVNDFLNDCIIVDINQAIKMLTIDIRRSHKIKLPDAIIGATAQYLSMSLVSADQDFKKVDGLQLIKYEI